jgi:hypothetical protein
MNSLGNAAPSQAIFRSNAPVDDMPLGGKPLRLHSAHENLVNRTPPAPSNRSFSKSQSSTETIDLADDDDEDEDCEGKDAGKKPAESSTHSPGFLEGYNKYRKTPDNPSVRSILTTGGPQRVIVAQPKTTSECDFDDLGVLSANNAKKTKAGSAATKSNPGSGRRRKVEMSSSTEEESEHETESGRLLNVEDETDNDFVLPDVLNISLGLTETSGKYSGRASSPAVPGHFPLKMVVCGEARWIPEQMAEPRQGFLELSPMKGIRLTLISVVEEKTHFVYIQPHNINSLVVRSICDS